MSRVVGEALALAALLGASLKFDGTLTLQTRSDGPLRMIVADYTSPGTVRACATFDREAVEALGRDRRRFADLVGERVARDHDRSGRRHGALSGHRAARGRRARRRRDRAISSAPSRSRRAIKLSVATLSARGDAGAAAWRAGGIMIQNLAALGGRRSPKPREDRGRRLDARVGACSRRSKAHELVDPQVEPSGCSIGCSTRTACACSDAAARVRLPLQRRARAIGSRRSIRRAKCAILPKTTG